MSRKKNNLGVWIGMTALSLGIIGILNQIAKDPRISPVWRKIASTAEGDVYQHIISGAVVTILG